MQVGKIYQNIYGYYYKILQEGETNVIYLTIEMVDGVNIRGIELTAKKEDFLLRVIDA